MQQQWWRWWLVLALCQRSLLAVVEVDAATVVEVVLVVLTVKAAEDEGAFPAGAGGEAGLESQGSIVSVTLVNRRRLDQTSNSATTRGVQVPEPWPVRRCWPAESAGGLHAEGAGAVP